MSKNTNVAQYKKVELWTNDCYSCDRHNKYQPIRRFVLDKQIPLANYVVIKPITDMKWQKQANQIKNSYCIKMPFVMLEDEKGVKKYMDYDTFVEEEVKVVKLKKKLVKRTTSIKKKEVRTVEIEKGEENGN